MSKNIIAIDASSSAVGYAVYVEGKLITSGSVHLDDPYKIQPIDRVPAIEMKFANELSSKIKQDVVAITGKKLSECVDTIVFNLGYVQSNGVDQNVEPLKDVQSYIKHILHYKLKLKYEPVLDISWIEALKAYTGFQGDHNILKQRSVKKKATVYSATKIKYGEFKHIKHIEGAFYQIIETGEVMSDDEADAIFSGYAYMFLDIPKTTTYNRKEKNRLSKKDKLNKDLRAIVKKIDMNCGKRDKLNTEIESFKKKNDIKQSKVNDAAISVRRLKIDELNDSNSKLEIERVSLLQKIQKL